MSKVNVTVAIADEHLAHIMDVAEALQTNGLRVLQIMDSLGVVTGVCDSGVVDILRQINGVNTVEITHTFHLAPPDSKIQ
ncbi:hypothetical protein ACQ4M4_20425 [Leptolyngbya sp. AN02str]|uniref:hypothetical protein n=1 Tax=Leptolyngbya sp. AN02str TaxID=3423363 RepID=UPI003D3181EC